MICHQTNKQTNKQLSIYYCSYLSTHLSSYQSQHILPKKSCSCLFYHILLENKYFWERHEPHYPPNQVKSCYYCTIKHVLLECKVFDDPRKHYFHANTMKDLFENVHMDYVLSFLKETGLYQKI